MSKELKQTLEDLLHKVDLNETTPKQIRQSLEQILDLTTGSLDKEKEQLKTWTTEWIKGRESNNQSEDTDEVKQLRKLACDVKVHPGFWKHVDRSDSDSIRRALEEFCLSKGITSTARIPTKEEIKAYRVKREVQGELEGISSENVVSGKRKRANQLPF